MVSAWLLSRPRPTPRGVALAGVAGMLAVHGLITVNLVSLAVSLFFIVMIVAANQLCATNVEGLTFRRQVDSRTFAGQPLDVSISVFAANSTRHGLLVEDEILGNGPVLGFVFDGIVSPQIHEPLHIRHLEAEAPGRLEAATVFRRRGEYSDFRYRISSSWPFGLFIAEQRGGVESTLVVYPKPVAPFGLHGANAAGIGCDRVPRRARADSIGEFRGLREYRHGDPLKLIHWRLSQRYLTPVVREFDPPNPERVVVLYHAWLPRGKYFDNAAAERSLQQLAGIFLTLYQAGVPFDFRASFTNWRRIMVEDSPAALAEALGSLATPRITGERSHKRFLDAADAVPCERSRLIVVSPLAVEHWQGLLPEDGRILCIDSSEKVHAVTGTSDLEVLA
jgi:uncharacterized protein (DUF58 family)